MPTPYEVVRGQFETPFPLYKFQVDTVNELAPLQNAGYYLDLGCGKTAVSIFSALYKLVTGEVGHIIVLMPPILLDGWYRFLSKFSNVRTLLYRGTPAQRADLPLGSTEITLLSYGIFKTDNDRFYTKFRKTRVMVIADEASALKNIESKNHRVYKEFTAEDCRGLLTGTPLSTPLDAYAYCKLVAPTLYRSMKQFENVHVLSRDFFGRIEEWQNLDLLADNMRVNSKRILRTEVLQDLPEVVYDRVPYRLSDAHMKLYNTMVEEQLIVMDDGGKIDITQAQKLRVALQQVVVNYDHFSGNPKNHSAAFELVDSSLEDGDGEKLVIVASYRMTNAKLYEYYQRYNAVVVYGGNTGTVNRRSVDRFCDDPSVRAIIIQPTSGGYGVDGLQDVCHNMLFLEYPPVPRDFHQTVARLHRNGQKKNVHVRVGEALGTVQTGLLNDMLNKDALTGRVVPNVSDLRALLMGGS